MGTGADVSHYIYLPKDSMVILKTGFSQTMSGADDSYEEIRRLQAEVAQGASGSGVVRPTCWRMTEEPLRAIATFTQLITQPGRSAEEIAQWATYARGATSVIPWVADSPGIRGAARLGKRGRSSVRQSQTWRRWNKWPIAQFLQRDRPGWDVG